MSMTQREYWYWLCNIKGIYNQTVRKLVRFFGSPEAIFHTEAGVLESELRNVFKLGNAEIERILSGRNTKKITADLDKIMKRGIRFVHIGEPSYPERLTYLYDPPQCLYVKGNLPDPDTPCVAMVGARACSEYGKAMALNIAGELADYGVQIISGLARGIDAHSMWGAILKNGKAYGILGCGVDICYPRENIELFERTKLCGGIISEFVPDMKPKSMNFPIRNRIISGLADVIIIIEANIRSGSLITAEFALEQGKDVYAVPGRVTDPLSAGCNKIISSGAGILTNTEDIIEELNLHLYKKGNKKMIPTKMKILLEKNLEVVYSCVGLSPKSIQMVVDETGFEYVDVVDALVQLQLADFIYETSKGYFVKKSSS